MLASIWQEIDAVLSPIIGGPGVAMLYRRSHHLVGPAFPWLASASGDSQGGMDLEALDAALAAQDVVAAASACGVLLQTFHELLASLIGASLTEQLLLPVWANFSGGSAAQDSNT